MKKQVGIFLYGYDSLWLPKSLLEKAARPKLADALFGASRGDDCPASFQQRPGRRAGPSHRGGARHRHQSQSDGRLLPRHHRHRRQRPRYPGLPPTHDQKKAEDGARGVDRATAILRALAPDAGSYVSESNFFDADWREDFWGTNYPRLAAIKAKYDPDGLFTVHHGVGSEAWSDDGFTRRA